jgi:hypothetical protein
MTVDINAEIVGVKNIHEQARIFEQRTQQKRFVVEWDEARGIEI